MKTYAESEVIQVPVGRIRENPLNHKIYNESEDDPAFVQSVRERGILEPLVLNKNRLIVSGSRRLAAARKLRLKEVPALVRKFSNDNVALIEYNRYRQKTPLEIYREAQVLRNEIRKQKENGKVEGDTRSIAAEKLGVSEGYLQMLEIVAGSKRTDLIKKVDTGVIGVSQAYRVLMGTQKGNGLVSLGRYFAGKQALTPKLVSMIPAHHTYVEVFGGFCSVLLNKPPSEVEVFNDISKDVVNFILCLRDDPLTVVSEIEASPFSRWYFSRLIDEVVRTECGPPDPVRAAKWWCLNFMAFAGLNNRVVEGNWSHSAAKNLAGEMRSVGAKTLYAAARLRDVQVENYDWRKILELYDGEQVFLYLDPPYHGTKQASGIGLPEKDHEDLHEALMKLNGEWLLTYNDHPRIRELYRGCRIEEVVSEVNVKGEGKKAEYWKQLIITPKT